MILGRRTFLAGLGAATTGLALGWFHEADARRVVDRLALNAFIQIGVGTEILIVCHRSEMGQGIRSTLPVLIADELGADLDRILVVQGDGDPKYGDQNTDGSTSIRNFFDAMREIAAGAREMLIAAAAARWRVPAAQLVARESKVHDTKSKRFAWFGELVVDAAKLPPPKHPQLRPLAELAHLGTDLPLRDAQAYVSGTAQYAADIVVPDLLVAVIARPPANLGAVATLDATRAKATPGVRAVVTLPVPVAPLGSQPLGGVAVIADHTWAALRGRAALDVTWQPGPNGAYDSAAYTQELLGAVRKPGDVVRKVGDVEAALASAATRVEAEYVVPHLVHAPMEPMAALARIDGDRCEIWACTQDPQDAREAVAGALKIPKEHVTVHVTFLGGGFGRKSIPDFCVEAALLAREAKAPVRVQWTREDEIQHAYYHTHSAQALAAGLDAGGDVVAWRHRLAYPSIGATFAAGVTHPGGGELGQGVTDLPLAIPNVQVETGAAPQHVRIGWMRSVCNVQQAFAVQSFVDELAHATKRDMRDMLLRVLGPARTVDEHDQGVDKLGNYGAKLADHPIDVARHHRVIERVTDLAGWDKRGGRALGLAVHRSFLSYIGVVASAVTTPTGWAIDEVWVVGDAGIIVNRERVRSQLEGAVIFAMSSALHGEITMKAGAVEQRNFRDYPLLRMPAAPRAIHVELIASDKKPGGIGEPGVPPVAPAIANAVFALTGTRLRSFPMVR